MKRQGRQHGMVRTYPKPRSLDPTACLFTRVSSKPTNHSKFSGKCGRPRCNNCHALPACKSRDKAKGAHKMRPSSDFYSLITWRVVDAEPGFKISGFSAKGILDYLASDEYVDGCGYEEYGDDHDDGCYDDGDDGIKEVDEHDDDDRMSFCEVGFVWEAVDGDESWCLVGEM